MKFLVLLTAASCLAAQERSAFEAVSIKPNASHDLGMSMQAGGSQLKWTNSSLKYFVEYAYGLHDFEYSGPSWLDSACFDIVAKLPDRNHYNLPEMLQTMLADRFKLTFHRETREAPGLALVVDKKGLRIKPVDADGTMTGTGPTMVQLKGGSMAQFANALAGALSRPVQDATGAPGVYDIDIKWTGDMPASSDPGDMPGSVYAAVGELGLHLRVQKVPVHVLVVDRMERTATDN